MSIKNFSVQIKHSNQHQINILPPSAVIASISKSSNWFMWKCTKCVSQQRTKLQSKESFLLKTFLCNVKYSETDIFQDNVLNDKKKFMSTVTKLSYDWEIFSDLHRKYNSGNIFVKKSKLKEKIDLVDIENKECYEKSIQWILLSCHRHIYEKQN